jgi:hypothetical protein
MCDFRYICLFLSKHAVLPGESGRVRLPVRLGDKVRQLLGAICLAFLLLPGRGDALGLGGFGASAGIDLTQSDSVIPSSVTGTGTSFNSARLAVGGFLNLGEIFTAKLDLVPGFDAVIESELKIYSINTEARYRFYQKNKAIGYAGGGIGIHLFRPNAGTGENNETKGSLNIPIGYQKQMSGGFGWFTEMKLVIADSQNDSSFRFSLGLVLGSF